MHVLSGTTRIRSLVALLAVVVACGVGAGGAARAQAHAAAKPAAHRRHPRSFAALASRFSSVKQLSQYIDQLKARAAKAGGTHDDDEGAELDYLEAYRYYLYQRAYPNDRVDWSAYPRAMQRRDAMPPAHLGAGNSRLAGAWQFIGPTNLAAPYQLYFGPSPVNGRVNAVAYDPVKPGVYYIGAPAGGVWKTKDAGVTWRPLTDGWPSLEVSSLAVDPKHPNTIYAGTGDYDGFGGYPIGLMKSTNGGKTWTNLGAAQFSGVCISKVVVDPDSPNVVLVTTGRGPAGAGYVWRSADGGSTWTQSLPLAADWSDIKYGVKDPKTGRRWYYAVAHGPGAIAYKSNNRGLTWKELEPPVGEVNRDCFEVAPSAVDANTVFMMIATLGGDNHLLKSTDGGYSFTDADGNGSFPDGTGYPVGPNFNWNQDFYDAAMTCAPGGKDSNGNPADIVIVSLLDVAISPDGGQSWQSVGGPIWTDAATIHTDQHAIAVNPANPSEMLMGNDGGVYRLTYDVATQSATIDNLNAHLGITQFYKADFSPTDPTIMLGGTQDNATPASLGDLSNWVDPGVGDGGAVGIDPIYSNVEYLTSYPIVINKNKFLQVYRTDDYWTSSAFIGPQFGNNSENAAFLPPLAVDQTNGSLYVATDHLYTLPFLSTAWVESGQALTKGVVMCLASSPTDGSQVYSGGSDGQIWMTRNSGAGWTELDKAPLPGRAVTSIAVNPNNSNDIIVSFSGTGADHVWECPNTTANALAWVDVSGTGVNGLPDIPVNVVARDIDKPETTWYVGTDIGIFYTTDGGKTYQNATQPLGLPNVQVNDLKAIPGTRYLHAATFGRGMWRIALPYNDTPYSVTLNPSTVVGSAGSTGTVTLNSLARPGGVKVTLASDNAAAATVPVSVTVPEGTISATFPVATFTVQTTQVANISATAGGATVSAPLTVQPWGDNLTGLTLNPTTVAGTAGSTGTITLAAPARTGGVTLTLGSTNTAAATVPATVTVPAGQTTVTFPVSTLAVANAQTSTISASWSGLTLTAQLTVQPWGDSLAGITLNPNTVAGVGTSTATVTLNAPARTGGVVVNVGSDNTSAATTPASVTVQAGQTSATFQVATLAVTKQQVANISATWAGTTVSAPLTVQPPVQLTLQLSPTTVPGGKTSQATVTLVNPAPAGGAVITLSSSNPSLASMPASITIPAMQKTGAFTITAGSVLKPVTVTINAAYNNSTASQPLQIVPPVITSFTFDPNPVEGGSVSLATIVLSAPCPAGGSQINLINDGPFVVYAPDIISVQGGQQVITFRVISFGVIATVTDNFTAIFDFQAGSPGSAGLTVFP